MTPRRVLLAGIAERIAKMPNNPVRVGIDGVDGAGKTIFADELAEILAAFGRPVIRASVDSFHHPRSIRYRQGRNSPRGFFEDSYDYVELRRVLLDPLSPGGSRWFKVGVFDHRADCRIDAPEMQAVPHSVLIVDGIFLHREELRRYWDFSIFLRVDFDISIPRGAVRGEGSADPSAVVNQRYVDGQRIYLSACRPTKVATMTIDNSDLRRPYVVRDVDMRGNPTGGRD